MNKCFHIHNEAEMIRFGGLIAQNVSLGCVIALTGHLGVGKTTLTRAIVRSLMGDETIDVVSPTFSLVQFYEVPNKMSVTHVDLYRLQTWEDVRELHLSEALETGILIIEWPERIEEDRMALHFPDRLDLHIIDDGLTCRRITLQEYGAWKEKINWSVFQKNL